MKGIYITLDFSTVKFVREIKNEFVQKASFRSIFSDFSASVCLAKMLTFAQNISYFAVTESVPKNLLSDWCLIGDYMNIRKMTLNP